MDPLAQRLLVLAVVVAAVLLLGGAWRVVEHRRRRHAFDATTPSARAGAPGVDPRSAARSGSGPGSSDGTDLLVPPGTTAPPGLEALGRRATFVVVGTRGCSDCARTLAQLRRTFDGVDGVDVQHVLAEKAPGLVHAFRVRTAPTVLLADTGGRVVGVHPGAVDPDVAVDALRALTAGEVPFAAASTGGPR